jgi:hypothetical protein
VDFFRPERSQNFFIFFMSLQTLERPETTSPRPSECLTGLNYPLRGVGIEVGIHEIPNPGLDEQNLIDLDPTVDLRWAGFVQGSVIVPHFIDENTQTKNIVRGSVPVPIMAKAILPEIMTRARERFVERSQMSNITSFNSADNLLTVREKTGRTEVDDDVLALWETLDDAVAEVVNLRYSERLKEHPSVREYFAYHKLRSLPENRKIFRERVRAALTDPNSQNENAFTSEPNAPFFMKMTVETDGTTMAKNVDNEDVTFDGRQTVSGLGHNFLADTMANKNRLWSNDIQIEFAADVSTDAAGCADDRSEKGCAAFFKAKMRRLLTFLEDFGESINLLKTEFLDKMSMVFNLDSLALDTMIQKPRRSKSRSSSHYSEKSSSKCANCGLSKIGKENEICHCDQKDHSN